jgi:hypothetical protein
MQSTRIAAGVQLLSAFSCLLLQGLKATGSYLARTLSYHGAEFTLADIQLSPQMRCDSKTKGLLHYAQHSATDLRQATQLQTMCFMSHTSVHLFTLADVQLSPQMRCEQQINRASALFSALGNASHSLG